MAWLATLQMRRLRPREEGLLRSQEPMTSWEWVQGISTLSPSPELSLSTCRLLHSPGFRIILSRGGVSLHTPVKGSGRPPF